MALPKRIYHHPLPSGGVNDTFDILSVGRDQLWRMVNYDLDLDGRALSRLGCELINTTALNGEVTSIEEFRYYDTATASFKGELLVSAGLRWYYLDSSDVFQEIATLTSSEKPSVVTFADGDGNAIAILTNGTEIIKYTGGGTTATALTADVAFPWTSVPRYLFVWNNRLCAAGDDTRPTIVDFSERLDPDDWDLNNDYLNFGPMGGNFVKGLGQVERFLAVVKEKSIYIVTNDDFDGTTQEVIRVSDQYGTTSHWSIQTIGSTIHFLDSKHAYRGILRQAVVNGLDVDIISNNIRTVYGKVQAFDKIDSVYDPKTQQIYWGVQTQGHDYPDKTLVYSKYHSIEDGPEPRYVWCGYRNNTEDGVHQPTSYGKARLTTDVDVVYRGDSNGYVVKEGIGFKDQISVLGVATDKDIASDLVTGAIYPGGLGSFKIFKSAQVVLWQNHESSAQIYWVIDAKAINGPFTLSYEGDRPYWNEDGGIPPAWSSTIWMEQPTFVRHISINAKGNYLFFQLTCDGSRVYDRIGFNGLSLVYRLKSPRRTI